MLALKNLSVIRKLVQLVAFVFFIYGGLVTGYYLEDKMSGALPALSCAYDMEGTDLCTLIPFQHQMDHRLGETIARGGEQIHLAGIDDAHYYRVDNIEKAASGFPHDDYSVLLSHTPEVYRQAAHAEFNLMLSGHTLAARSAFPVRFR